MNRDMDKKEIIDSITDCVVEYELYARNFYSEDPLSKKYSKKKAKMIKKQILSYLKKLETKPKKKENE